MSPASALDAKGHFAPIVERERQAVDTAEDGGFRDAGDVDVPSPGRGL